MVPLFFRRGRVESMLHASVRGRSRSGMRTALVLAVLGVLGVSVSSALAAAASKQVVPGEAERERALRTDAAKRLTQRDGAGRREERLRSRTALRGASRAELLRAGRLHFPDVFSHRLFDGKHPDPQMTVMGYRGDSMALVKDADGRKLLMKSTMPLRARAANGELAAVDLSLRESAETFTTANSNADLQIFKDPADGIRFLTEGFSISAFGAPGVARPDGVQADGRVFFDDAVGAGSDVSFVAVPKPTGVEVGWLVATADAPETYALKLDLPDGARVRRTRTDHPIPGDPPRTFEIVDRGGKTLAFITPPVTFDSDGLAVESSMRVVGRDRLVVDVEHHDKDLRYPLFVDPEVMVYRGAGPGDWNGWSTYQSPTTPTRVASDYNHNYYGWALDHGSYYPYGAYMSMPTRTFFDIGTGRGFEYRAPANTYVSQATFGNMLHAAMFPGGTYNSWWQGILNGARNAWQHLWIGHHSAVGITHTFAAGASNQNYANMGIGANAANWYGLLWSDTSKAILTLDWANVYIADPNPPQLTSARPADQGWSATASRTRTVAGYDLGTGLLNFRLTGSGVNQTAYSTPSPCHTAFANWQNFCPIGSTVTRNFTYTPAEGSHSYTLQATDAAGGTSTPHTWTEKIDRRKPEIIALDGWLPNADGLVFTDTPYDLSIEATDSLSGVESIEVLRGTQRLPFNGFSQNAGSCDGCSLTLETTWTPTATMAGPQTITVVVRDKAGNEQSTSIPVKVSTAHAAADQPRPEIVDEPDETDPPTLADVVELDEPCNPATETCPVDDPSDPLETAVQAEPSLSSGLLSPLLDTLDLLGINSRAAGPSSGLQANGSGWGLSDQKFSTFVADNPDTPLPEGDLSLFRALSVERLRLVVPWDLVPRARGYFSTPNDTYPRKFHDRDDPDNADPSIEVQLNAPLAGDGSGEPGAVQRLKSVDTWIEKTLPCNSDRLGEVLISFEASNPLSNVQNDRRHEDLMPTADEYMTAVTSFRKRYNNRCSGNRKIRVYTAWNEPNFGRQPFYGNRLDEAGTLWNRLQTLCKTTSVANRCTVAAGDFIDRPFSRNPNFGLGGDIRKFASGMKRKASAWALHAYSSGHRPLAVAKERIDMFLKAIKTPGGNAPKLWLTEQGGRYSLPAGADGSATPTPEQDVCRLMQFRNFDDRITRFYYYNLVGPFPGQAPFDSALVKLNADGSRVKRPQYDTYRFYSAGQGAPNC